MIEAVVFLAVIFLLRRGRRARPAPPIVVHVHQYFCLPPDTGERQPESWPANVVPLRRRDNSRQ